MLDQFRVGLGRKQKGSFKNTKIVVDVPTGISEEFIEAFETKLVTTTTESWEFWYGLLVDYQNEHEDCLVRREYEVNGFNLGNWVKKQRNRKEILSDQKQKRLEALGFVWDPQRFAWEEGFKHLATYRDVHGDCLVQQKLRTEDFNLGSWVNTQRRLKESLSNNQLNRLNDLGFIWDSRDLAWHEGCKYLCAYQSAQGDCLVPMNYEIDGYRLGRWVNKLRGKKERLNEDKIRKLNSLDFIWDSRELAWNEGFKYLYAYQSAQGDCLVPMNYEIDGYRLGRWVSKLRSRKERLDEDKIRKLNSLDFIWNSLDFTFEEGVRLLSVYKDANKNLSVPNNYEIDGFKLGIWASNLRRKKEILPQDKIRKLDALEFIWSPLDFAWGEGFKHLTNYKDSYGDCLVPHSYQANGFKLGSWVNTQRTTKMNMSEERTRKLDALEFVWSPLDFAWGEGFKHLTNYKDSYGDCLVPQKYQADGFKLGRWVSKQRQKRGSISKERIKHLDSLGFAWKVI
jgi:hypothetical protein